MLNSNSLYDNKIAKKGPEAAPQALAVAKEALSMVRYSIGVVSAISRLLTTLAPPRPVRAIINVREFDCMRCNIEDFHRAKKYRRKEEERGKNESPKVKRRRSLPMTQKANSKQVISSLSPMCKQYHFIIERFAIHY